MEQPGSDERLRAARIGFLQQNLSPHENRPVPRREVELAIDSVDAEIRARGRHPIEVDPESLVARYAAVLHVQPDRPIPEVADGYARVGLTDPVPRSNPDAESLIARVEARGTPVIAISDTTRTEAVWQEFFRARTRLRFRHILTSCEVGRAKPDPAIFRAAARRLDLPPSEILHVGDRWDRDVLGALGVGFGATLYTGLRRSETDRTDPVPSPEVVQRMGAVRVHRLDDPALLALLE